MFRAFPRRTLVLSVIPVLVAVLQSVNVLVNDVPLAYGMAFVAVMLAAAAVVTRRELATFRRRTLEGDAVDRAAERALR
jgi:heme exporter protein D